MVRAALQPVPSRRGATGLEGTSNRGDTTPPWQQAWPWLGSLVFFGLLVVGTLVVYGQLRELTLANEGEKLSRRLGVGTDILEEELRERRIEVLKLAVTRRLEDAVRAAQKGNWQPAVTATERARYQTTSNDDFIVFALALPNGTQANSMEGKSTRNLARHPAFQAAIKGQTYVHPPDESWVPGEMRLTVSTPLSLENREGKAEIVGVVAAAFSETAFLSKFADFQGEKQYGFILDRQGRRIFSANSNLEGTNRASAVLTESPDRQLAAIAQAMTRQETGVKFWQPLNQPRREAKYVAYQPIQGTDWAIALVVDAGQINMALNGLNTLTGFTLLLLTIAGYLRWRQLAAVTQQSQTLSLLADREQQLQATIANVDGAVYRIQAGEQGKLEYLSDFVETLLGYPAQDFLGDSVRSLAEIILPEDEPIVAEKEAMAQQQGFFDLDYRVVTALGQIKWVNDRGRAQKNENGELLSLHGVLVDITARKNALRSLQKSLAESQRLNQTMQRWLAQRQQGDLPPPPLPGQ
ncbi:MAG TPA: hypothetical protein DCQ32_07990 [Cyanobacteria bacterium UBA8156]|nr:hypothetical protein [Cyanobacteria bacterium UBA8156]